MQGLLARTAAFLSSNVAALFAYQEKQWLTPTKCPLPCSSEEDVAAVAENSAGVKAENPRASNVTPTKSSVRDLLERRGPDVSGTRELLHSSAGFRASVTSTVLQLR